LGFITVVESVYSAVRTDSVYKADYVSSLKGYGTAVCSSAWKKYFVEILPYGGKAMAT
jgi:hypothetical protein